VPQFPHCKMGKIHPYLKILLERQMGL
jgi:hypothetical protein